METKLSISAKNYLLETSKWAKFLAIVSFIGIGLIVLFFIFMALGMSALERLSETYQSSLPNSGFTDIRLIYTLMGVVYTLIALIYFFPTLYLYRFADKMKKGLLAEDSFNVDEGLKNLKSVFKFWGLYTAIFLGLYAVLFVFGFIFSLIF